MICPRCGRENPAGRSECSACRAPLEDRASHTAITEYSPRPSARIDPATPTQREGEAETHVHTVRTTGGSLAATSPSAGGVSAGTSGVSSTGELILGTVFANRYEVVGILGQGGMGRVYKARDRELDKLIALKTIRLDTAEGPDALARFKQELVLARKVTHKNVVRIFDLGEAEGIKFFTMEYIEGESLKALIRRRGPLPVSEVVPLARQILGALEEAHSQGIVHRDLKPQNVMVAAGTGTAHLMDFGIARATDGTSMTATGAIVGTPDYMSPEQVKGERAGMESDVFSVGVMLYEMLTGELPYQADTPMSKVMMRLSHRPRSVREIHAQIPKYLERVVKRCLEIDPALRYQRAGEVLADLERESVSTSFTLRISHTLKRRRQTIVAFGLLAVAAATFAWWVALRPRAERAAAAAAAAAPAGPVRTLAILPLTNAAASAELDWMREGLADMLVTDLAQSRYVRPVPGERVLRVLKDIGAEAQTRFDASALEAISKRAPAQTVLYGQFVQSGDTVRLDLSLRQAGSGVTQPIKAEARNGDVLSLVDHIATAVKQQLDLTPEQIKGDVARPFSEVATSSVDALRLFHEGAAALRAGSAQDAIAKLRDATAKDPQFAMAWTRLAEAYADAGEQREAESAAERAQTLAEKAPLPLAQRYQIHAAVATVKEDLETAAKSYGELAALYPQDPDVQYRLAATLRGLGQQPEAIAAYQKVLQLSPGYGAAEIELAGVMWQAGRSEEAIRMLKETLGSGRFKDDSEALGTIHSILGNAYRDTAQVDKALESLQLSLDYRRKAGDKRGQVVTLTNLASLHEQAGAIPKAIAAEKEALRIAREMRDRARESFVLHNMGMTYSSAGDLQRSLQAFRDSLQIEMERGNASEIANRLDKVADAYRLMGRYDDALVYLEQAKAQLAKTDAKQEVAINQQYFGQVYAAQGRFADALTAFQAALPVFQEINQPIGIGMAHSGLAEVYTRQGRYADAWTSLSTALDTYTKLKAEHDIAEVKAPLGRLAAMLGRTDEAEALIADTAKFAGHGHAGGVEIDVQLAQAELLRLRGKAAEAAEVLEHAITQAHASAHLAHATEASVALARLRLAQGKPAEAVTIATRARLEAEKLRRRPVEAEALATLAAAQASLGRAEPARRSALDAISLAEKYEGRPVLVMARAALARALEKLGRPAEATDAWARAAADLDWIRGSLKPEHAQAFMARADVQSFLGDALPRLDKAGRGAETSALQPFLTKPKKTAAAR
jgi:tetratricopeptide (TPR) repeat protein/predicted Ser/Thr protein kinase